MSSKSVFSNPRLKSQKASRNAFDLGHKRVFHASLGQILPIFHADVPAGSYIELGEENQTYNMNPLVRPAFTRIKEHIDYFAVPKVQLWSLYDNFITGQSQYMSSSLGSSFLDAPQSQEVPSQLPMFNGGFLSYVLENKMGTNNPFGVTQLWDSCKLLDLLGYGNFYTWLKNDDTVQKVHDHMSSLVATNYLPQNFMNLLAYQKIYYSYFRNSKYEKNIPTAYNLDWLKKSQLNLVGADFDDSKFADIFTLHYRWLKKDYFMGMQPSVLPSASDVGFDRLTDSLQAGMNSGAQSVNTVWQLFSLPGLASRNIYSFDNSSASSVSQNSGAAVSQSGRNATGGAITNVSALRFAFAFDKLLRRMRSAGATFDDQMLAQFGIKPIDMRHGDAYYLGGFTNRLNLNEVISTSEMRTDGLGQFGSNISKYSDNPKKITYHAKEDVIIMGIYSTSYDVDYPSCRYERDNLRRYRFDHYNPAFENLGLQAMYNGELCYINDQVGSSTTASYATSPIISPSTATNLLGFNKRYIEYKTKLDVVNGLFNFDLNNADMMAWTTQYRPLYYDSAGNLVTRSNDSLAQPSMLVNPIVMDDIVTADYNGTWEHDHFMCNLYNKCTMIANMSIDGEVF